MRNRRAADNGRVLMVESAIAVAERDGIDAVESGTVADRAGVPERTVRNEFGSDDALLIAISESLARQMIESMRDTFTEAAAATDLDGVRGLRVLLHSALSGFWPIIEEDPERRMLTFELTSYGLRHPQSIVASEHYRALDEYGTEFLEQCAERTGTTWLEPVGSVARLGIALLDGLVLRWMVDRRSEAMLAQLDDVAAIIAAKAME